MTDLNPIAKWDFGLKSEFYEILCLDTSFSLAEYEAHMESS